MALLLIHGDNSVLMFDTSVFTAFAGIHACWLTLKGKPGTKEVLKENLVSKLSVLTLIELIDYA